MKRFGLWALTIFLASAGGGFLRASFASAYGEEGILAFLGLLCALTAAAIYSQKLHTREPSGERP